MIYKGNGGGSVVTSPPVINIDRFYWNDYFLCGYALVEFISLELIEDITVDYIFSCLGQEKCTKLWFLCNFHALIQTSLENSIVSNGEILWFYIAF